MGSQDWTLEENGVSRPSPGPSLVMQSSIPLAEMSNSKNKPGDLEAQQDQDSVLSGISKDTFEEERGVTCTDIKLLQAVWALEEQIAAEAASKVSGPDLAENNA